MISPPVSLYPIPLETARAVALSRETPPASIVRFWGDRLISGENIVRTFSLPQAKRDARTPAEIRPVAGTSATASTKHLMRHRGMGGLNWMLQCAYGFAIAGAIAHRFTYSEGRRADSRIPRERLYAAAAGRFRGRAAKSGRNNAQVLWGDAMEQVNKFRNSPPTACSQRGHRRNGALTAAASRPDLAPIMPAIYGILAT